MAKKRKRLTPEHKAAIAKTLQEGRMTAKATIAAWLLRNQDEDAFTAGEEIIRALQADGYAVVPNKPGGESAPTVKQTAPSDPKLDVERLRLSAKNSEERGWLTHAVLDREAADEIERLRLVLGTKVVEYDEEIERLRAQRDEQDGSIRRLLDDLDAAQTEIERLRVLLTLGRRQGGTGA